ncbi:MAG: FtsL-like putative cell division protein [Bacteroidales bacterium]|nr:FtsL-like putative cell division protein [Bacteroidales bacterium]MDD4210423.1 FtsL-like putative cell division protein [Bacteroidales bacterium]
MANRIDPSLHSEEQDPILDQPKVKTPPKKRISKKPIKNSFIKGINVIFVGFFGGGFLKLINFKKNWLFILYIVLMLIFLIYNNLSIQSSRNKIDKLKDNKIKLTTEYMKIKQKTNYLDELQGQQLAEKFKEEGYVENKSLEYKITVNKEE